MHVPDIKETSSPVEEFRQQNEACSKVQLNCAMPKSCYRQRDDEWVEMMRLFSQRKHRRHSAQCWLKMEP